MKNSFCLSVAPGERPWLIKDAGMTQGTRQRKRSENSFGNTAKNLGAADASSLSKTLGQLAAISACRWPTRQAAQHAGRLPVVVPPGTGLSRWLFRMTQCIIRSQGMLIHKRRLACPAVREGRSGSLEVQRSFRNCGIEGRLVTENHESRAAEQ